MSYLSTRSKSESLHGFEEVVMQGLAKDGGLFIPVDIPKVPEDFETKWANDSFEQLAFRIMRSFIKVEEIPDMDLAELIEASYKTFRVPEVTPVKQLADDLYLLELFHGPTYAFKDVALQFVGNLFEYFLKRKNGNKTEGRDIITVVGATSGDTGSAAIYGLRNKADVSVFILYPDGRISPVQEAQMATVQDPNVHTITVDGTFDDCQDLVKQIFADEAFNEQYHIGAVNSINWARILAQITYYFASYFTLKKQNPDKVKNIKYVVPTGNFGDILAGYYAKRMGLPIDSLVIATNENDILDRFFKSSKYAKESTGVHATLSPAMDIAISSNFERFLWYLARDETSSNVEASAQVAQWMTTLKTTGEFAVSEPIIKAARSVFSSQRVSDEETIQTITKVYKEITPKYVLDPHSAVAVTAALRELESSKSTVVALSTAHPAKFSEAVDKALKGEEGYSFESVLPEAFKEMMTAKQKHLHSAAKLEDIKKIIVEELAKEKAI